MVTITEVDLVALAQIANRIPMTQAEIIWINWFIERCRAMITPPESEEATHE